MKKILIIILSMFLVVGLTACGSNKTIANKNGSQLKLTMHEIEKEKRTGFFVKHSDNTFTPVMNNVSNYAGDADGSSLDRYLWYSVNKIDYTNLIPKVGEGTKLVGVFDKSDDMPSAYTLEKYAWKGYTVGCHFTTDKAKDSIILESSDMLADSNIQTSLSKYTLDQTTTISKINGSAALPVNNVDTNMSILLGLEKNAEYRFDFYTGTKTQYVVAKADTAVLQSSAMITLNTAYQTTNNGYFIINLPDNLANGFYYVCGEGLFEYEK